ncbi:MAG TPA: NAD(P)H-hydrate epimerase, partial [Blastocatellia bacterium]|nr:NAD(P)H-hydrate epimerase [Blastocatellia bacterium]
MKILSAAEMREVDRLTTERYKIPSLLLMENAAVATVEAVEKKYGPVAGKRALIVCGRGNNGGDGAAIARQLWKRGCSCAVLLLARVAEARGDARTNFEIAQALAVTENPSFQFIEVESFAQFQQQASAFSCDFIFDAMFGTGLTRPVTGIYADVIRFFSETEKAAPVIAVDIPSGIASDSAELMGVALRADLTVTFTAPKVASVLPPACDYSGELVTASIGSPDELITSSGSRLTLIERDMVADWLAASRRSPHANKGDAGKVLIIAGSRGKTGAACLAGEAALRAGAGLVTIATPESAQPVIAAQAIAECMTEALAETGAGAVAREAIARALDMAKERDVLALGPGLGSSEESTRDFAHTVVAGRERPMVIDADGLNALAPWPAELGGSAQLPIILTP